MTAVLLLALSVSVDACAAALCARLREGSGSLSGGVRMACWFGGFQTGMSLLGALAGRAISVHVQMLGALLAFGLLCYLGGTQLLSALRGAERPLPAGGELSRGRLLALALATSLDALAVGVSLAYLEVGLVPASAVIGLVTLALTLLCALAGRGTRVLSGGRAQRWAAGGGGVTLMLIGAKILAQAL